MQTPGHFSAVVFRNRTWKPHFLSFVENVNGVVVVFKQYISAVVVRNPFGLRYRDALDHLFWKKTSENCFHVLSSQRVGNYITKQKLKLNNSQFYEARRKLNQDKKFIHLYTSLQSKS